MSRTRRLTSPSSSPPRRSEAQWTSIARSNATDCSENGAVSITLKRIASSFRDRGVAGTTAPARRVPARLLRHVRRPAPLARIPGVERTIVESDQQHIPDIRGLDLRRQALRRADDLVEPRLPKRRSRAPRSRRPRMSCDPRSPSRDLARSRAFLTWDEEAFSIHWTIFRRSVSAARSVAACSDSISRAAAVPIEDQPQTAPEQDGRQERDGRDQRRLHGPPTDPPDQPLQPALRPRRDRL